MAGTALACAWISLPGLAFLPIAAGIGVAWVWQLAQTLHWGRLCVRALELGSDGSVLWQDGARQWHEAEILPSSYVSAWLMVVNLVGSDRRPRPVILLPDCAAAEELRGLRVWLRWQHPRRVN